MALKEIKGGGSGWGGRTGRDGSLEKHRGLNQWHWTKGCDKSRPYRGRAHRSGPKVKKADESLAALGFTEHSFPHVLRVSDIAGNILEDLGYSDREIELARIAGYIHDIGNMVNRIGHSQSGAVMAFELLRDMGMKTDELCDIVAAIGNHDEGTGVAITPVAAALIIADKSDVRRSRVRNTDKTTFDIHDRVNYSVEKSTLRINKESKTVTLRLTVDTEYGSVMDYFEIFLGRMIMCRKAAEKLGLTFRLVINEQTVV